MTTRKWVGHIDVLEVPQFIRHLHAGWMIRNGVREKVQLRTVRYEEGKHDNTLMVVELRDGTELLLDVMSTKGAEQRTQR